MAGRRFPIKSGKRGAKVLRSDARPLLGGGGLVLLVNQFSDDSDTVQVNQARPIFPNELISEVVSVGASFQNSRDALALIQASQLGYTERAWVTSEAVQPALLNITDFALDYVQQALGLSDVTSDLLVQLDQGSENTSSNAEGQAQGSSGRGGHSGSGDTLSDDRSGQCGPSANPQHGTDSPTQNCEPDQTNNEAECTNSQETTCVDDVGVFSAVAAGGGLAMAGTFSTANVVAGDIVLTELVTDAVVSSSGASVGGGGASGPLVSISGAVIDGYVKDSFVYADLNGNGAYDNGEPSATTDELGAYTFSTTASLAGVSIIAEGGIDQDTLAPVEFLKAPAGVTYVTPISSLAAYATEGITDEAELEASLTSFMTSMNFAFEDLSVDPVAVYETDPALLETGASILTAVATSASLLAGFTGSDEKSVASDLFQRIAQKDATELQAFTSAGSQDTTASAVLKEIFENDFAVDSVASGFVADAIGSVVIACEPPLALMI